MLLHLNQNKTVLLDSFGQPLQYNYLFSNLKPIIATTCYRMAIPPASWPPLYRLSQVHQIFIRTSAVPVLRITTCNDDKKCACLFRCWPYALKAGGHIVGWCVRDCHVFHFHTGNPLLTTTAQQRFWILPHSRMVGKSMPCARLRGRDTSVTYLRNKRHYCDLLWLLLHDIFLQFLKARLSIRTGLFNSSHSLHTCHMYQK